MQILVQKDGQQLGPYTPDQVNEYLAQGSLQATDPAWHDGLADWCPLNQIAGVVDASSSAPPAFDPETFNPSSAPPPAKVQSSVLSATPDAPPVIASDSSCPQCQAPTKPEMLFCRTCGHDLQGDRQIKSAPQSSPPIVNDVPKQKFPIKIVLLFSGGALSLLCIVALIAWIFFSGDKLLGEYESTTGEGGNKFGFVLKKDGIGKVSQNGNIMPAEQNWKTVGDELHFEMSEPDTGNTSTLIFSINDDGSLTGVAFILDRGRNKGVREKVPLGKQQTLRKKQ